jgi:hypothetical protein
MSPPTLLSTLNRIFQQKVSVESSAESSVTISVAAALSVGDSDGSSESSDSEEEYEVESILKTRMYESKVQYLTQWAPQGSKTYTPVWEPADNLRDTIALQRFLQMVSSVKLVCVSFCII